jgi:tetratricopeptide (TPR) repeat protein
MSYYFKIKHLLSLLVALSLFKDIAASDDIPSTLPYQNEMQLASGFYEIKAFPKATALYQELLKNSLTDWQRAVVLYNMGSIALAEGNTDRAIKIFESVPLDDALSPLLIYRTKANLALAYWQKARSLARMSSVTSNYANQEIALMKSALEAIPLALQAHCTLEQIEGVAACSPVPDLVQLQADIERKLRETKPTDEPSPTEDQQSQEPSGIETKTETSIPEKGVSAMDQVLKLLLEMEAQDGDSSGSPTVPNKSELRPW